jgi:hypothetical protein
MPHDRKLEVVAREARSYLTAERPVACFGDLQPFDFERLSPFAEHALTPCALTAPAGDSIVLLLLILSDPALLSCQPLQDLQS